MAEGQAVETKGTNPISGGVINSIVGTVLGLATANYNDRRQERLNRKMADQQKANAKEMAMFNQQLGLDTWEKTGYGAQRRQMEEAGLNVGLMYGGAGSGGTTNTAPGQMTSTGVAPHSGGEIGMGIQSAAQLAMMHAQIENTKASTENIKADTAGKQGDTAPVQQGMAEAAQRITKLGQETANAAVQGEILKIDKYIKDNTASDTIAIVTDQLNSLRETVQQQETQNKISKETADDIIKQAELAVIGKKLENQASTLGLQVTTQQIEGLINAIQQTKLDQARKWEELTLANKIQLGQETARKLGIDTSNKSAVGELIKTLVSLITWY